MKRNKLITISAIAIAVTVSIAISTGFGRSKVLMEIEAYERQEAAEQAKASNVPSTSEAPNISSNSQVSNTSDISNTRCERAVEKRNDTVVASQAYLAMGGRDIDPNKMLQGINSLEADMYRACKQ